MNLARRLVFSLACLTAAALQAQDFEYGSVSELSGARSVFVLTGADLKLHDRVVRMLREKLPGIVIEDDRFKADVSLVLSVSTASETKYESHSSSAPSGWVVSGGKWTPVGPTNTQTVTTPHTVSEEVGAMMVVAPGSNGHTRVLAQYEATEGLFTDVPTQLVNQFVKAYKQENPSGVPDESSKVRQREEASRADSYAAPVASAPADPFSAIQPGMSKALVKQMAGEPAVIDSTNAAGDEWRYLNGEVLIRVRFDGDLVKQLILEKVRHY